MRKGFTRNPKPDEPTTHVKNYITPSGLERLKNEHRFLLFKDRPAVAEVVAWAAGNGDRSENADYQYSKRRLRQIDGRIRFLTKRIEAAEVVDPEAPRGKLAQSRRALMKSAAGDSVVLHAPAGTENLTVLEVRYERIPVEPFREPPGSAAAAKGRLEPIP
jgi:transcription elongation factor GreB